MAWPIVVGVTGQYRYDIALSFAAEQRDYVQQVAARCEERDIRVFYDEFEQASLWGKNLYEHLSSVYSTAARYCLVFVSADYARRAWTTLERRSAQERAFEQDSDYLLPVIFDETRVPGIWRTLGYIDARTTHPARLVEIIQEKLSKTTDLDSSPAGAHQPGTAPHDVPADRKRPISSRPRRRIRAALALATVLLLGISLTLVLRHRATGRSPSVGASGTSTMARTGVETATPSGTSGGRPPTVDQAILSLSKDSLMVRLTVGNKASSQQLIMHAVVTLPGTGSMNCTAGPSTAEYRYTLDHVLSPEKVEGHGVGLSGGVEDSQVTQQGGERYLSPATVNLLLGTCLPSDVLSMNVDFTTTVAVNSGDRANINLVIPKSLVIRSYGKYIGPHRLRLDGTLAGSKPPGWKIKVVLEVDKSASSYSISSNFAVTGLP